MLFKHLALKKPEYHRLCSTECDRRFKARDNSTMALLFLEFPI
ncbi:MULTISPECIES: hypothetical protein [Nostocales]|nr:MULTISPECIES: hypothetical protein [Nostocales]